jgi:GT2 family glycosyltransferase
LPVSNSHPFVSIIIPTFREWHLLSKCLKALEEQSYPKQFFEVIVVNNDPTDLPPHPLNYNGTISLIAESVPGSYAARNTGVRKAKGNILGFTDSDCVPDKDWIQNAVKYLENNKNCSRVAGEIAIMFKSSHPSVVEMYNQIYAFPQKWLIANGGGSITGNLFTYKHLFENVGYFDEKLMSMGDVAWGKLAQKAGYSVHYVPDVVVLHPARDLKALVKKEKRHGGGAARMSQRNGMLKGGLNLIYQFRPRINSLRFMLSRRKDLRIRDRLFIPLLRYYLLNIRAFEKFKVMMGKAPNRE